MGVKISPSKVFLALAALSITGCGWVDSASGDGGSSSQSVAATDVNTDAPSEGDNTGDSLNEFIISTNVLMADGAVSVNEDTTTRFALIDAPASADGWTWRAAASSDSLTLCNAQGDFDGDVAITDLDQACSSQSDCNFLVQEFDNNGRTEFEISLPTLSAPAALSYILETNLASGELHTQAQTVCATAINEAPDVRENRYRTVATAARIVDADASDAVLLNDSDDEHVRNQSLFIKEVTTAPLYAEDITVNSDGSFRYKAVENLDLADGESLQDRINIIVSDGVHDVESAILLNIVNSNEGPALQTRVPDFTLTPTDRATATLSQNLAQYFTDADGDSLQYQLNSNEFTDAGVLTIDENGQINGSFSIADIRTVAVTVSVSDGLDQVSDRFNVIVRSNQAPNQAPTVTDIRNDQVSGIFQYDVSVFFSDPDGDTLSFTSDNLPANVTLSSAGLLTGFASNNNDGRHFITITASDNRGGTVDDSFRLTIDN